MLTEQDNRIDDAIKAEGYIGMDHVNYEALPMQNEYYVEDAVVSERLSIRMNQDGGTDVANKSGLCDISPYIVDTHDQLVKQALELTFQIEYFKSYFEDLKKFQSDSGGFLQDSLRDATAHRDVKALSEKIESLNRELQDERQTRGAAEEALKHLRAVYSEADAYSQDLSARLAEAQQKMDEQVKERDEKYTDLDSKFNRLHKRAKQRIQEVQKEKEDVEAQLRDANERAEQASLQQSALQQELERVRQQANEALKAMDVERQQLRCANNKLRDNIEELRCSLEPKESALEALQISIREKEQILGDMHGLILAADEKRQASLAELTSRHQKSSILQHIESLEAQLADTISERNKLTQNISSLQTLIAARDSKIAAMDAASSGEAARLRAVIETVKGELTQLKQEHEEEKDSWKAASEALSRKLEITETNCIHAEIEAAKIRSQLELELSVQTQLLNTREADLMAAREEIKRLDSEFFSYKTRAHALLQRKDADLAAARDNKQLKDQEEALKEAEKEIFLVSAERDKALRDLKNTLAKYEEDLSIRDAALNSAEQKIKDMEGKLNSAISKYASEKDFWERNLQNLEEMWRLRCEALKAQIEMSSGESLHKEIENMKSQYKKLKEEHDSFRNLADVLIEEKDKEISRLIDDNKNIRQSQPLRPLANNSDSHLNTVSQKPDGLNLSTADAEHQILVLARQQAQREEELSQSQRHILVLQEEIEELERENRLHGQQEAMLKEELRNLERMQKREGVDMTYLKNVILKLLETGEVGALLPVVAMLLQFSSEEMQKCQQAYQSSTEVQPSSKTESSGPRPSLFSRFSFS